MPSSTPTIEPSPTATATKEPSPSPTSGESSPTKTEGEEKELSFYDQQDSDNQGEVLGEKIERDNKGKFIAAGLISLGGGLLLAVGGWPYFSKIFATIKKYEE